VLRNSDLFDEAAVRENRVQRTELSMGMQAQYLDGVRLAQRVWGQTALARRLRVIARLRKRMASAAIELAEIVPTQLAGALHRSVADTIASEVLPLIEACRFLEREAETILRTRAVGAQGRPVWLGGVDAEIERAPLGVVLVLGAANYPLLLAGVQTLQALVAGNAVLWKPAPGTAAVAFALRTLLLEAGLEPELLTLLDTRIESAMEAIEAGIDHVVLTGSADTGKVVLHQLAETLTPATMELSGCDAVFVLPGADVAHTIRALGFGLRFNGSFTCMAPRRVFLVGSAEGDGFEEPLVRELEKLAPVPLLTKTYSLLGELIEDARSQGAEVLLDGVRGGTDSVGVTVIGNAIPSLRSMQTDVFAPVLSVMRVADVDEALAANAACGYALTASIFGPEKMARALAGKLRVGNVLINDVIVPTADPRVPFGGRGRSGFGVTRGAEGLLAMTSPRVVQVQRGRSRRAYEPTGDGHVALFAGLTEMLHGGGLRSRWRGLVRMVRAGRLLK
jgi:acyl-CoA reductase-like NAD-dependent aldehyde dehydrogenase